MTRSTYCARQQRELAALEADSQHIRFFLPLMITGLLQTPERKLPGVTDCAP
jgi:hypothetical protein